MNKKVEYKSDCCKAKVIIKKQETIWGQTIRRTCKKCDKICEILEEGNRIFV